jgi:hypothetical protein
MVNSNGEGIADLVRLKKLAESKAAFSASRTWDADVDSRAHAKKAQKIC